MKYKNLSWSDCSVSQFQEVQDLIAQEDITPTDFILEVGDVFFDIDEEITDRELKKVKEAISFISKPVECTLNKKGLQDFKTLTLAQYIDLDVILVKNNFVDAIPLAAKILYSLDEEVMDLPITDVYKAVESFNNYRTEIGRKYFNIFDTEDEEDEDYPIEEEEPQQQIDPAASWMQALIAWTQGDITKYGHIKRLSHILVFNWVSVSESLKSRKPIQSE